MRVQYWRLTVATAALVLQFSSVAQAEQGSVKAESSGIAVGGNVSGSILTIGIPSEQLEHLVATRTKELTERSEEQKKLIDRLEKDLDLNERQISAALEIVGERNITPTPVIEAAIHLHGSVGIDLRDYGIRVVGTRVDAARVSRYCILRCSHS